MTLEHDKPKRWRPRFSVRTMAVVVTLVCCYAACWGPTKKSGPKQVGTSGLQKTCALSRSAVVPLVVAIDELDGKRRDYFWLFGYVARLPYERTVKVLRVPIGFGIDATDVDTRHE